MCDCQRRTVQLHNDGRHFTCAHCRLIRTHPFFDYFYSMPGHAFCDYCGLWMKIGNLDDFIFEEDRACLPRKAQSSDFELI